MTQKFENLVVEFKRERRVLLDIIENEKAQILKLQDINSAQKIQNGKIYQLNMIFCLIEVTLQNALEPEPEDSSLSIIADSEADDRNFIHEISVNIKELISYLDERQR